MRREYLILWQTLFQNSKVARFTSKISRRNLRRAWKAFQVKISVKDQRKVEVMRQNRVRHLIYAWQQVVLEETIATKQKLLLMIKF
jgi:hypothetical protein